MEHSGFPSNETLAAFIDGRLDAETRKRVIAHMASCSECRSTFVSTNEMRGLSAAQPRRYRLRWTAALAAALLLALIFAGRHFLPRRDTAARRLPPGVDALIAAANQLPSRPSAARITGFPYRAVERTQRGAPVMDDSTNWRSLVPAASIQERAQSHPAPENLHAYGISLLLFGNADAAIKQLESAITKETRRDDVKDAVDASRNAPLLSDLSAAYFAAAQRTEQRREELLLSALDAAQNAWDVDPRLPEVAWNRAVCLEALSSSRDKAIQAWDDYLRLDAASGWAKEARQRRDKLATRTQSERWNEQKLQLREEAPDAVDVAARLADLFPQEARELAQSELLPAWAEAERAGDAIAAKRRLGLVRTIAAASAARGDTLLERTVAHVESSHDRARLADGFTAWRTTQDAYTAGDMTNPAYEAAIAGLAGSPFAPVAQYQAARAVFNRNDYEGVLARLRAIPAADLQASHWLRGKVLWLTGLTEVVLGHQRQAIDAYEESLEAFAKAGEEGNQLSVFSLLATNDGYTADHLRAWQRRLDALQRLRRLGKFPRAQYILADASRTAAQEGHRGAALLFADEMLQAAQGDAVTTSEAYLNRGLARYLAGDEEQARVELGHADHWAAQITNPDMRARTMANTELTAFDWRNEPADAKLRRLDGVIEFLGQTGKRYDLARIYFLRARVACGAGRMAPCESDFKTGLAEASKELRDVDDPVLFGTYVTTTREATDGVTSLLLRRNDARAALPYIDCNRLLFSTTNAQPLVCAESLTPLVGAVQRRLPGDAGLLELAVIDGRLLSWLITQKRVDFDQRDMPARAGEAVLAPFAAQLRELRRLVIVSDRALADVTFAALINPATGHRLTEDVTLSFQASAATFAASPRPAPPRGGTLVVCNAAYDANAVPGLEPLAQAKEESVAVAQAYGGAEVLRGSDATPQRFLAAAGDAAIVHYVGHAKSPRDVPLLAALVLAPDGGRDSGLLYARDIARARFPRTSLVVLSACSAAVAAKDEEAGVTNLARAFLAAGVPGVIASTAPVDDGTAPEFFRELHGLLAKGIAPAEALQRAQIEMIRRGSPPFAWAGFQYLGSI